MRTTIRCLLAASLMSCSVFADYEATPSDGVGFDGFLTEVDRPGYVGSFNTTQSNYVRVRQAYNDSNGDNATRHYVTVLKFDLSEATVDANDLIDARLRLTVSDRYTKFTGAATFKLGVFTGDDTLITEELGYDADNPFIASDYVGETDPDTDFEPGTVSELLTYDHSNGGEVDEVGRNDPAMLAAIQEALNTDGLVTFLIYGPNDGSDPSNAAATSEYYILPGESEEGGPVLELIDAPAPFLGAEPSEGYAGDPLELSWYVDPAATDLSISSDTGNDDIGDVSSDTASNGLGELVRSFPLEDTSFTLNYTLNGSPQSHSVSIGVLDPFFTMDPDEAVPGSTSLEFAWRIEPGASPVILESGPNGGPYTEVANVTADTDETGAGSYNAIATDGQTEYRLRYTSTITGEVILSDTLTFAESSFESLFVSSENGTNPEISPNLALGDLAYLDRDYTWTDLPDFLLGTEQVLTTVEDRGTDGYEITLETDEDGTLFLLIDNRVGDPTNLADNTPTIAGPTNRMGWVKSLGFVDSGIDASIEEDTTLPPSHSIFFRPITAGETLMLGEQDDGSTRLMYTLALATPGVELDGFGALPNQLAEFRSTTLRWAVPAGSTVELDNGSGAVDVSGDTDPTTGIGEIDTDPFVGVGLFNYTLTYTPAGESPVVLGPIDVDVIDGPADSFVATPEEVAPGDTVTLTIQIPPVSTDVSVVPYDEGGSNPIEELRTPVTLDANGFAEIEVIAPAINDDFLEYELQYTLNGSLENEFSGVGLLLDPEFSVSPPAAFAGVTELAIGWRVPANPTAVTLNGEDVLSLTDIATGNGSTTLVPTLDDTDFVLAWESPDGDDTLDASIEVFEATIQSFSPTNYATNPVIFDQPLLPGVLTYNDRDFIWLDDVPDEIRGAQYVQSGTDNADKNGESIQMDLTSAVDGTMILIIDDRVGDADETNGPTLGQGAMNWVPDSGFIDSELNVTIDHAEGDPAPVVFSIFARPVTAGETVSLFEQFDGTGRTLFTAGVVAGAIDATNFWATPATIEEGALSTLQWIVEPGSSVEIDQGVGDVTGLTDATSGAGSTTVSPALGDTSYTLTYTPAGGDPVELGPITVTVTAGGGGGGADFVISDITIDSTSGEAGFKWPAPDGVTDPANLDDVVYSSIDLLTWTEVDDGELMIADGMVMFTDPTPPAGGKVFYRIDRP